MKSPTLRVFVPKGTGACSRTSAFGTLNVPIPFVKQSVRDLLAEIRHQRCLAEKSATRVYPVKKLRAKLFKALSIDVALQPATVEKVVVKTAENGVKTKKTYTVTNPIWVLAPGGAFYKSKRISSLVTDVVMFGGYSKIAHDLERLSIHIWNMSRRHFDGLVRRIRSKLTSSVESDKIRKSPETVKRLEALITNPLPRQSRKWFSRNRTCPHKKGYAAMRLSTKVDVVTESHKCKKCTRARRA